jgi:hypothetical protein
VPPGPPHPASPYQRPAEKNYANFHHLPKAMVYSIYRTEKEGQYMSFRLSPRIDLLLKERTPSRLLLNIDFDELQLQ